MRVHRRVWLWWGPWWAVQLYVNRYLSLGAHIDFRRPYIDLHLGWLIMSLGDNPVVTNQEDRLRGSCRGFRFAEDPVL